MAIGIGLHGWDDDRNNREDEEDFGLFPGLGWVREEIREKKESRKRRREDGSISPLAIRDDND